MFETLRNAWKIEDLRRKLIFTMMILLVVRVGSAIPVPFIDPTFLKAMVNSTGNLLGYLDMLTGGAFSQATLFALSISPYITSSIVIQLLTVAIPALERMAKEGPEGQERLKKITHRLIGGPPGGGLLHHVPQQPGCGLHHRGLWGAGGSDHRGGLCGRFHAGGLAGGTDR